MAVDDIVKQAIHFSRIVITGETFVQKEEIIKLVKKTLKNNPEIIFELHTNGTIRPTGLNNYLDNIIINVFVLMKRSSIPFNERIKSGAINWFNESGANFCFEVLTDDDIDEARMLVHEFGIKKAKVFLIPSNPHNYRIMQRARYIGYNYAPKVGEYLWKYGGELEDGRTTE